MTSTLPRDFKLTISCNFAIRSADRQHVCTYGVQSDFSVLISILVFDQGLSLCWRDFQLHLDHGPGCEYLESFSAWYLTDPLVHLLAERHVATSCSRIGKRARSVSCLVRSICGPGHWWTREQTISSCKPRAISLTIDNRTSGVVICYEG